MVDGPTGELVQDLELVVGAIRTMPSSTVGDGPEMSDTATPSGRPNRIVTVLESRPPIDVGVPLATISA